MSTGGDEADGQAELMLRVREAYLRTRELRARLSALRDLEPHIADELGLSLAERAERQAAERDRVEAERATRRELDQAEQALTAAEAAVQGTLEASDGADWVRGASPR